MIVLHGIDWPSIAEDSEILRKRIAPELRLRALRRALWTWLSDVSVVENSAGENALAPTTPSGGAAAVSPPPPRSNTKTARRSP